MGTDNPITRKTTEEHPALPFFRQMFADKRVDQKEAENKKHGLRKLTAIEKLEVAERKRERKREKVRSHAQPPPPRA